MFRLRKRPFHVFHVSRREFVGNVLAAFGGLILPADAFGAGGKPLLRLGVISDIHLGSESKDVDQALEKALRYYDVAGAEAILVPGDTAHSGLISEMERFAKVWDRVFPECRARDGRKVELMMITGNHCVDGWGGRWRGWSEERLRANRLNHGDNLKKTWDRLFHQPFEIMWRREVKGVTFVGAQWTSLNPPIEEYFRKNARAFDPSLPFFYTQHPHPKDTCHGRYAIDEHGNDNGESVRALSPFPNAVAITGHSHCSPVDERTVWQGAFTSIGAGCLRCASYGYRHANAAMAWHPLYKTNVMRPIANREEGRNGLLIDVFKDHLLVHRRAFYFGELGEPLGADWCVPLPAAVDGPFDFRRRAAKLSAPQFAKDAEVKVVYCKVAPPCAGVSFVGKPMVHVTFPAAQNVGGSRVFDYDVMVVADGQTLLTRPVMATGFALPEARSNRPGECLFKPAEIPGGRDVMIAVTPKDCFGNAGRTLRSAPFRIDEASVARKTRIVHEKRI